ncbi:hypothetical protein F1D05_37265 [Kribbella qitaiheensis]|uniref:TadE-like domain-containing protein n=1 Tax=Kribbella qitaiheensis TaxID=1544730 RepID=A0A7G6X8G0_9ACTN|nr:hypothetical protein F1D05_37265 [Kribbella qitaiheensis]
MNLGKRAARPLRAAERRSRPERGTMALEMVILAPLLLILFMFLLACGRYFQTSSQLENAARDGARSASQARSLADAQQRIDKAVTRTMGQSVESCKSSASGTVTSAFAAGSPLSVEVTCTIDYRDLGPARYRRRHQDHQEVQLVPRPLPRRPRCPLTPAPRPAAATQSRRPPPTAPGGVRSPTSASTPPAPTA